MLSVLSSSESVYVLSAPPDRVSEEAPEADDAAEDTADDAAEEALTGEAVDFDAEETAPEVPFVWLPQPVSTAAVSRTGMKSWYFISRTPFHLKNGFTTAGARPVQPEVNPL